LLWSYWPTFTAMADLWAFEPQYSHGFLVPVFAALVLWARRAQFPTATARPDWWGVAWLALALLLCAVAAFFYFQPLDGLSLLPTLVGIVLLAAGRPVLRWCWPAIAFLAFMLPLPFQIDTALAYPLRGIATAASTYLLQTLGYPAFAEGNVIVLDDLRLGVVGACSGLGMLMTFFALATAVALLVRRPLGDRIALVVSAVPIALVVNVARITATAVAHQTAGAETADLILHDLAGWLMMPLALGLLGLELWLLDWLLPAAADEPVPLFLGGAPVVPSRRGRPNGPDADSPPMPYPLSGPPAERAPARETPRPPVRGGR
jgi:exosortase